MPKHILIVSQYFYPETFRINDIAEEWVKRGYKVTVLTAIPNYPEGKFYKGFGLFKRKRETYKGIEVKRLNIFPRGKTKILLMLNYISFVLSGFFWKSITSLKPDLVFIFEVSPMTQALPGVWFAKRRKIPSYIYVQDLWPENLEVIANLKNKKVISAINKMVDYIYENCTTIFVTSKSFRTNIINRNIPKNKVVYWPQYAEEFCKPIDNYNLKDDGIFKVMFTGNIGEAQGLLVLPELAKRLYELGLGNKIKFTIVGDGRNKKNLVDEIDKNSLSQMFEFIPRQDAEEIPGLLSTADVAFLSFKDNKVFRMTIPSKLQTYLACGKPIFAIADGETKKIIAEAGCGLCSKPGDLDGAFDNLLTFYKMSKSQLSEMSRRALEYSKANFDKITLLDKMDQYFK